MESLYILIPLSALLVLLIIGIFGWAVSRGQFDDLEREGERILTDEGGPVDAGQARRED
jgi:cbb3-type cytochrome oxidase maturation protein